MILKYDVRRGGGGFQQGRYNNNAGGGNYRGGYNKRGRDDFEGPTNEGDPEEILERRKRFKRNEHE